MKARYDDLHTGPIAYATFISCVLFLIVFLLLRALSSGWLEAQEDRLVTNVHYTTADAAIAEQKERISSYAKVQIEGTDAEGQTTTSEETHIPVDAAVKLILEGK